MLHEYFLHFCVLDRLFMDSEQNNKEVFPFIELDLHNHVHQFFLGDCERVLALKWLWFFFIKASS